MKWIVITPPDFIDGEAAYINHLFEKGLDLLHLRKPSASAIDCKPLLNRIDKRWHSRIVVHDHFSLCHDYLLHGIHLNSRHPLAPKGFNGSVSRSCHSLDEVETNKPSCDYVFLSPIFDSISKQGYTSHFTTAALREAAQRGIIDQQVMALGGITLDGISQVADCHFGGAAFLGDIWRRMNEADADEYLEQIETKMHRSQQ